MRFKNTKYNSLATLGFSKPEDDSELKAIQDFQIRQALLNEKFVAWQSSPSSFISAKKRHKHKAAKTEFKTALRDTHELAHTEPIIKLFKKRPPYSFLELLIADAKRKGHNKIVHLRKPKDDFFLSAPPIRSSSFSRITAALSFKSKKAAKKQGREIFTKTELIEMIIQHQGKDSQRINEFNKFLEQRRKTIRLTNPYIQQWLSKVEPLIIKAETMTRLQNEKQRDCAIIFSEACQAVCNKDGNTTTAAKEALDGIYAQRIKKIKFRLNDDLKKLLADIKKWINKPTPDLPEDTKLLVNIKHWETKTFLGNKTELQEQIEQYLKEDGLNLSHYGIEDIKISMGVIDKQETIRKTKEVIMLWHKTIIDNMIRCQYQEDEIPRLIFTFKEKAIDTLVYYCNKHKDPRAINLINLIANKRILHNTNDNMQAEIDSINKYTHKQIAISAINGNKWAVDSLITLANNFGTNEFTRPLSQIANRAIANSSLSNTRFNILCSYTKEQILKAAKNKNSWAQMQKARWEIDDLIKMANNHANKRLMCTIAAIANKKISIAGFTEAQHTKLATYTKQKIREAKADGQEWAIKITTPQPKTEKNRSKIPNPFRFFGLGRNTKTGRETPAPAPTSTPAITQSE